MEKWEAQIVKGNIVQEPTYNLDDYLLINFIGKWHFGKKIYLNMNYYNQMQFIRRKRRGKNGTKTNYQYTYFIHPFYYKRKVNIKNIY